ncbi:hypothetical protein F8388_010899 [Cannabis sativa]|uniref:Uncharacterized protein n=1 Tax=Cannabis sativa TaxID=3483 RepID=A0A7J6DW43_CANSA|nr:hypothetical protein F8388_010899 [Cannabis sativa]
MLQFPGFMTEYPWSTTKIPTSFLLPSQWPQPQSEELLLAMEESEYEDKLKMTSEYLGLEILLMMDCVLF